MLSGQAGTHHVIGGFISSMAVPRNVGGTWPSGGKGQQDSPGARSHQVHHEGHEQTAVTGVLAVHDAHELGGVLGYHIVRGAQRPGGGVYQVLYCGGGGLLGQAG